MQKLKSYIDGDFICFETTHFSEYAVVDESPAPASEAEDSHVCVYCGKIHKGVSGRFVEYIHDILSVILVMVKTITYLCS